MRVLPPNVTWNYRIIREEHEHIQGDSASRVVTYGIHEVYYAEDGAIHAYTQDPVDLVTDGFPLEDADAIESIQDQLHMMSLALKLPVLREKDLPHSSVIADLVTAQDAVHTSDDPHDVDPNST